MFFCLVGCDGADDSIACFRPISHQGVEMLMKYAPAGLIPFRWLSSIVVFGLLLSGCASSQPPIVDNLEGIERANREQTIAGVKDPNASLLKMADHFKERGERSMAVSLYLRGLDEAGNADVVIGIGRKLLALDAHAEAAKAFRRAIGLKKESEEARQGYGLALLKGGRIEDSISYFDRLLRDGRYFSIDACATYGVALDLAARHQKAQQAYKKCLEKAADDLDLRSNLALSLALSGAGAKAIATSKNALSHPDAARPHVRNHVLILALSAREDEALAFGEATLGGGETLLILERAGVVSSQAVPIDRARSMGTMLGIAAAQEAPRL